VRRIAPEPGRAPVHFAALIYFAALISLATPSRAFAAEARPWLCRDKPAFSSDKPMRYEVSGPGGRLWQIFLMQFKLGSAHDGFDIIASHDLAASASAAIPSGHYFAVAMHLAGNGHWICRRSARRLQEAAPDTVTHLCFGDEDSDTCQVTLKVTDAPIAMPPKSGAVSSPAP